MCGEFAFCMLWLLIFLAKRKRMLKRARGMNGLNLWLELQFRKPVDMKRPKIMHNT